MSEVKKFSAQCSCGQITIQMEGEPRVAGICHCEDCRELLNIPYHTVNAWEKERVSLQGSPKEYQHPRLNMKKFFCNDCGDIVFNSNGMDWRVFSQLFIKKCYAGNLPEELKPKLHFFYGRRIINIADDLPKRD